MDKKILTIGSLTSQTKYLFDVIIRDEDGSYGLGCIDPNEDNGIGFKIMMYQGRLDINLSDNSKVEEKISEGKAYYDETCTLLEAVNKVLDFWFIPPIKSNTLEYVLIDNYSQVPALFTNSDIEVKQFKIIRKANRYE